MPRPKGSKNKKVTTKEGADFVVLLKVNGKEFTAKGSSISEALGNLAPVSPKTKGTFVITSQGKTSKPMIFTIPALNRIFYPGMTGEVNRTMFAKRAAFL